MVTIWVFTPSCVYWLKCFSCLLIMVNKRMNVVKLEVKYSTHNSLLYKHGLCDVLHRLCKSEHVLIYCIILQLYMMFTWIEWSADEKRFKMVTTNLIIVEEENIIFFCKKKLTSGACLSCQQHIVEKTGILLCPVNFCFISLCCTNCLCVVPTAFTFSVTFLHICHRNITLSTLTFCPLWL